MKKVFFSALLIMAANTSFSQIMKGQWLVGGDLSVISSKDKVSGGGESQSGKSVTTISLNPDAGYFFMDKLAAGLRLNFSSQTGGYNSLFVGPFVRYYFLPTAQKVNIFADGSFGFGSTKPGEGEESVSSTAFQIMAGPAIFLNDRVALQIAPFFRSQSHKEDLAGTKVTFTTTNIGGMVGFQIHLGQGATSSKK